MDATDEALMEAWAGGDSAAMRELVSRFSPRLERYFGRMAAADRADLLQQTFLKVHAARRTYRPGASFKAWLFTIASRCKIDAFRRRQRELGGGVDVEELADAGHAQDELLWQRQLAALRGDAVEALPLRQRDVLHLHYTEGLSFKEIADVWQVSENAVKQCAFRAYTALRAALSPADGGPG